MVLEIHMWYINHFYLVPSPTSSPKIVIQQIKTHVNPMPKEPRHIVGAKSKTIGGNKNQEWENTQTTPQVPPPYSLYYFQVILQICSPHFWK
jgi:hypothetical protein